MNGANGWWLCKNNAGEKYVVAMIKATFNDIYFSVDFTYDPADVVQFIREGKVP